MEVSVKVVHSSDVEIRAHLECEDVFDKQ